MTNSYNKVKTPQEVITDLNAAISDLSLNLEKTNAAHIETKISASQHIGALRTQLANCKCPGVNPEKLVSMHDWINFPEEVNSKKD